jgi:hypothetical protein
MIVDLSQWAGPGGDGPRAALDKRYRFSPPGLPEPTAISAAASPFSK